MKRITKFVIIGTGALLLVGSITACHRQQGPEQHAQWMTEKVSKELKLDAAQQAKLKALSDEILTVRKEMKARFGHDREQMMALLDHNKLDQAKVLKMVREHTQSIDQHAPKVVAAMGEFYDSLTPEQQAQVSEFVKEHHQRNHHWRHDQ